MRLEQFRRRHRQRKVRARGQSWGVIEVGGRRGAPVLVMLPGTLGTAEIFWNQIAALKGRVRVVSVTYPAVGDIFNIGVEDEITMIDLAHRVKQRAGSRSEVRLIPYEIAYGGGFEDMERRQPSIAKIGRVVGWTPTRSLDDIIDQTIEFHRAAGLGV